jgi:cytochrome c oxidase subunit I+III
MIIIGFPAVILGTLLLELERALGWPFFDPTRGGDPVLWQHLFWFFGHPEVYIIFLPAAGLMSMMIPTIAQTPLVGYRLIVLALLATGFISFGVWSHHMFATGMPTISISFFSAASMAVSVPAGVQVFSWIATLSAGRIRWTTPALFAVGSVVIFVMGGLTGVMVAMVPFDWQAHDTYFIVAHLHYVLIGGMVFPLFAAFYYWTPMMSRRPLSERLGRWAFGLMFAGVHVTFLPMHLTGLMGMPRRVYTYLPERQWDLTNLISTIGAFMIAAGVLVFIVDLIRNFRFTADNDAGNVFGAGTLEWLPTGLYSTRSIPTVSSRYPLWDDPDLSRDVEDGRYFLPRTATGERETIITSPLRAEPQYLQRMPGPSAWHVLAAVFTAGFFLLLTVQAYWPGIVSGVLAVACVLRWVWEIDWPLKQESVDIGAGIRVPTYATGPSSHGWWAMMVLLTVAGMIFLMAAFSYVFLWSQRPDLWIAPPSLPWLGVTVGGYLLSAVLAWSGAKLLRIAPGGGTISPLLITLSALTGAGTFWADLDSWQAAGLWPEDSGQGATVFALLSWQGLLLAVSVIMAGYVVVRGARGLISSRRTSTVDLVALFIGYVGVQGALAAALVRLFPGG